MPNHTLTETSPLYYAKAATYARFAACEDWPGRIMAFLAKQVRGKAVLDLGCGTGKYLHALSPLARGYHALDISAEALALAQRGGAWRSQVNFICSSAEEIPLPSRSLDLVFACWVLGTIREKARREQALAECRRVLRPGGNMLLIENDLGGEFEALRGRYPDTRRTKAYNTWLEERGFAPIRSFNTHFEFASLQEAKAVFGAIWGGAASAMVASARIGHRVAVFAGCSP